MSKRVAGRHGFTGGISHCRVSSSPGERRPGSGVFPTLAAPFPGSRLLSAGYPYLGWLAYAGWNAGM
jgi:hypothetical protein